jgi:hypothetical protein
MVDNVNPTSQFHPYQKPDAEKQTGAATSGLGGILSKVGIDSSKLGNIDMKSGVDKVRSMARSNPGAVLGGLAAVAIGAGLMRKMKS